MNALEIRGLTKRRGDFALQGLDLTLPAGCIMGLIGENGAGKSTTMRLILNSLRRDSGSITIYGKDNRTLTARDREDIGVVLDEVGLPEYLTAAQIGRMMAGIFTRWQPEVYAACLKKLGLPTDKPFKDYSRGMKMKQGLAVALSHQPRLLLLDEATSGLDPMVREEVLDILLDFTREEAHTVVLSSHIVSDLEKVCDYIAFLHQGKLLLFEEKDRLLEEYALVRLPAAQLQELDPAAIAGQRVGPYGAEALVRREKIPAGFVMEHTSLEDIILFLARKGGEPG